jgi:glucosamine-6-phosphate deaminase
MLTEILSSSRFTLFEKIPTITFETVADCSIVVAREIAQLIISKQLRNEKAVLGFATGSTPKKVYEELIRLHKIEGLSFSNVVAFNLDEYYPILPEAMQSYRRFMEENLFNHVDIDERTCFIPNGESPQELIKMHCEEYEKLIEHYGGIDIQLLGMGRNGHIGFNEPGSHLNSTTRLITLDYMTRFDAAYDFGQMAMVPRKAITMGVGTIMKSRRLILLAFGERKANIIKKAVEGPVTEFVPASYLQGHNNVEIFLDEAASAELTRKKTPWLTDEVIWTRDMIKKAVIHLAVTTGKPILKLTSADYNENGLSDLLALYGQAYDINIEVFNWLQHTITGWPGGKPNADDLYRPERAEPRKKEY